MVVMPAEYIRIQRCTTSKQAWDILEATHEGMYALKISKILKLNRGCMHHTRERDF